jgi:hypothetical protein
VRFGGAEAGLVRLAGRVDGALARRIALRVERGSGGGYDGCTGFRGRTVFTGTLDELPGAETSSWRAGAGDAATYRFTATAAADLPERPEHAAATFTWHASALPPSDGYEPPRDAPRAPEAPPAPAPPGGGAHAGVPGAGPASAPPAGGGGEGGGGGRSADRGGSGPRGGDGGARGGGGRPGRGPLGGTGDGPAGAGRADRAGGSPSALERAIEAIGRMVVDVGKRVAFPLVLLLIIALFLAMQHRIDKRDPKLALAPVHREHDLPFSPLVLGGGGGASAALGGRGGASAQHPAGGGAGSGGEVQR